MRFNKNYKRGLSLLFLLLIISSGITLVRNISKNNLIDENALSISALDDPMEDNDDFGSAWYVDPNWYPGLIIEGYDEDWFRTYLNLGETIDVSIYFSHIDGDLELKLYDPSYMQRTGSYSSTDDEYASFTADISGDWRIRVYRLSGSVDVYYDLDIWLSTGDDWMEENDEFSSAWWIDPNEYHDLKIVDYDEDWFRFYLNYDDFVEVHIYFNDFDGNLELELYDPSNNFEVGSYSSVGDEFISFTADESGDWRIRVYRVSGDSNIQVNYNLELKVNGMMGGDDPYEFNNYHHEAYDLHDDEYTWLSDIHGPAVQGDDDWYMIHVTYGFQHLIVNLMFDQFQGNINVDIHKRIDEHEIAPRYSNHSMQGDHNIDINVSGIEQGIYFIQVTGDYSGLEYDLWWDDLRTDTRDDDNYEENDDPLSAYDLSSHQYEDLWRIDGTALQRDNDWYKIFVTSGFEHLFVEVKYDYQEGAIGIEIYDGDLSKVTENFTYEDHELISYDLPSNGTYYIRIRGDHSGNIYSLRWETWEPYIKEMIPGYDVVIILGAIFGVTVVITLKWKRSKKHL
ncbi:MAG: PPC domain-containing protein [Candidatus Lokiarchaeota archaeon]|nr:PPC domain-containing protein [Candidatus Lokiarchaeota archaeon]